MKTLFEDWKLGLFDTELKEIYETDDGDIVARHIKLGLFKTEVKEKRIPKKLLQNKEVMKLLE